MMAVPVGEAAHVHPGSPGSSAVSFRKVAADILAKVITFMTGRGFSPLADPVLEQGARSTLGMATEPATSVPAVP